MAHTCYFGGKRWCRACRQSEGDAVAEVLITQAEVRDALKLLCYKAKREMPVVGTALLPTPYDLIHIRINVRLDELDMLKALDAT